MRPCHPPVPVPNSRMARKPALAVIAAAAWTMLGCAPQPEPAAEPKKAEAERAEAQLAAWPTEVPIYKNAEGAVVCPVMKAEIKKPEDAVGHQDFEGKRYYFCCGGCPEAFKAEPAKYAKK